MEVSVHNWRLFDRQLIRFVGCCTGFQAHSVCHCHGLIAETSNDNEKDRRHGKTVAWWVVVVQALVLTDAPDNEFARWLCWINRALHTALAIASRPEESRVSAQDELQVIHNAGEEFSNSVPIVSVDVSIELLSILCDLTDEHLTCIICGGNKIGSPTAQWCELRHLLHWVLSKTYGSEPSSYQSLR